MKSSREEVVLLSLELCKLVLFVQLFVLPACADLQSFYTIATGSGTDFAASLTAVNHSDDEILYLHTAAVRKRILIMTHQEMYLIANRVILHMYCTHCYLHTDH